LETEPFVDLIDAELDAEAGRSREERFEEASRRASYDGFDIAAIDGSLAEFPHCYGGLTAAGLLGAPIRMRVCDVLLPGDDETIDRFLVWLDENWARRWDEEEQRYSGMIQLDPRLPGISRWETPIGRVAACFVDAFPPTTTVTLMGRSYEAVGMAHLDVDDPQAKRVLERVRMRLASSG
jgi:hypothetical protein